LHGVVDGHTGRNGSSGAVDVEGDVLFGVLVGQVEELGDQNVGDLVIDALSQQKDSVLEQSRQNVHLSATGIDDGHSYGVGRGCIVGVSAARVDLKFYSFIYEPIKKPSIYIETRARLIFPVICFIVELIRIRFK
jgi:hypothetical protein